MKVRKQWIGSKKAASLGNLAELQEDMHVDLQDIREKMATKDMLKIVLDIVKELDRRTRGWESIPAGVTDLKNRVFKLEIRAKQ